MHALPRVTWNFASCLASAGQQSLGAPRPARSVNPGPRNGPTLLGLQRFWQTCRAVAWRCLRFGRVAPVACLLSCLGAACGSDAPARRPAPERLPPASAAVPAPVPESAPVTIKGLTGTLNKDDVHQTMDAQQPAFDACIGASRRRLRWVSGSIRFVFKVGGEGQIEQVHPIESTIGHRELEACLSQAVAATVFPRPAGRATATFTWGMTVEPVPGRLPEPLDEKLLRQVLSKRRRDVVKNCKIRRRERFLVTAYIARNGRVLSAGAVPLPPKASEKLECVLEEIASWRMPKIERHSKVSFLLR